MMTLPGMDHSVGTTLDRAMLRDAIGPEPKNEHISGLSGAWLDFNEIGSSTR